MDTIKNIIYAGMGLASSTSEKVKETINDLVEKGKISDTEGKKIMEDFFKKTENTKEEIESRVKSMTDKITSQFKSENNNTEVDELKAKIEKLEAELAKAKKPAAKRSTTAKKTTTTKKATTKKTTEK